MDLGIDIDGVNHPLAVVEGSTENTTVVRGRWSGCVSGAWTPPSRSWPCWTAPRRWPPRSRRSSITRLIGRCQLHKLRNVGDHLPEKLRGPVDKQRRKAYHAGSALEAEALLEALAKELDRTHPGAAASLRDGMAETLTVLRLGVPPPLARTLPSTNAVESMISICRDHARNVKRSPTPKNAGHESRPVDSRPPDRTGTADQIGIMVPTKGYRAPDNLARNLLINSLRAPAERANALLKRTWKALERITLDPWRIGAITAAALVLHHLQRPARQFSHHDRADSPLTCGNVRFRGRLVTRLSADGQRS